MIKELKKVYSFWLGWNSDYFQFCLTCLPSFSSQTHSNHHEVMGKLASCKNSTVSVKDLREHTCWFMSTSSAQSPSVGILPHKTQPLQWPQIPISSSSISETATLHSPLELLIHTSRAEKYHEKKASVGSPCFPSCKNQSPVLLFVQCLKSWSHILYLGF